MGNSSFTSLLVQLKRVLDGFREVVRWGEETGVLPKE